MDEDQVNEEQGNDPERQEVTFTEASDQSERTASEMFSAAVSYTHLTLPTK